ncbi:sodium:sulfate symporter [Desulfosarcina ovata subsp. sediminis]|uniref:Sodium:sulfate symporter n=1 Tax=Desulfosarcina ovata subsp. sediminis TaxID=885957 RepID=A0A5K7ZJX4_9BACT|nr:SLC13 family permease [Desulfosarcina ovata]BBO80545.1 sodium:sulfate symporter [Desulfosarcina ovata subsp. sediminis]
MPTDAYLTLTLLLALFVLLIKTKIPAPAIFLGALAVAMTLKLAPTAQLLKGFSNPGMLTVAVLFMVAAGMYATGAITMIMDMVIGVPRSVVGTQIRTLPPIAFGSAFLNNTPLVAMMIPVIRDLSRAARLPAQQLYLPMSFASILGGMCTVIGTSTNLVIAGMVMDAIGREGPGLPAVQAIRMFDPALVGVPIALVAIVFMILVGRFFLPARKNGRQSDATLRRYTAEFEVREGSRIVSRTLDETGIVSGEDVQVLYIRRGVGILTNDLMNEKLTAGDLISFSADVDGMVTLWRTNALVPHLTLNPMQTERHTHHLVKAVVSRQSKTVGRRIADLIRDANTCQYKFVALSRDGQPVDGPLEETTIEAGDNAVLEVNDNFFYECQIDQDFALTKALKGFQLQRTDRAVEASLITLAMIVAVALGWMSMLNASLLASGAMLLTGCLPLHTAARSIDWGTLVVIACAIGLESAVTQSGLAGQVAALLAAMGGDHPHLALAVIFLGCSVMTNVITNNAAAAFMFPIALSTAGQLGVSFMPFAITLMIAASCAFITPTGYQTNLMVWGPGEYRFTDFVKIGSVMTLIVAVMTILLTPMIYGF